MKRTGKALIATAAEGSHIPGYSTAIFWVMRKLGYD